MQPRTEATALLGTGLRTPNAVVDVAKNPGTAVQVGVIYFLPFDGMVEVGDSGRSLDIGKAVVVTFYIKWEPLRFDVWS